MVMLCTVLTNYNGSDKKTISFEEILYVVYFNLVYVI